MIIKSKIHDYRVTFTDNFKDTLEYKNAIYIIDENVKYLYNLFEIEPQLIINATENAKTFSVIDGTIKTLLSYPIHKETILVAIGGGIIQDLTAFISSILYRGISWIFYPTTLLAQADSCIGSKSSININGLKNQVGTFYPPTEIFIDFHFLKTLSVSDYNSGIGEIIKIGFLTNKAFWETIDKDSIIQSLKAKKKIIEKDEFDKSERNLLNYGHTFGHAIEAGTKYKIPHGLAVIIGMDIENYISMRKRYLEEKEFKNMYSILKRYYPAIKCNNNEQRNIFRDLKFDKKNPSFEILSLILTRGQGKMFKTTISMKEAEIYWKEYLDLRKLKDEH